MSTGVCSRRSWPTTRAEPVNRTVPRHGRSWLDDPTSTSTSPGSTIRAQVTAGEGGPVGVQRERHIGACARLELHPGEPGELTDRAGDLGQHVAQVELDDLDAGAAAGVAHPDRHRELAVGRAPRRPTAAGRRRRTRCRSGRDRTGRAGWGRGC